MFEPKHGKIGIKANTNKKIKEVPDIPEIGGWRKGKSMSKNDLVIKKPGHGGNGG